MIKGSAKPSDDCASSPVVCNMRRTLMEVRRDKQFNYVIMCIEVTHINSPAFGFLIRL